MKVSELIKKLQKELLKFGDCEITVFDSESKFERYIVNIETFIPNEEQLLEDCTQELCISVE